MTDRDVYSLIDAIVRDGKRRINAADREIIAQLLGAYQEARHTIAAELILLESQIAQSIASNRGELTEAWLRRQDWYQQLDRAIQAEATRLEATTRGLTIEGRAAGIAEGGFTGRATIQAAPGASFTPGATEWLIAAIQPGSPLDRVLGRYGEHVEASLREGITQGIIQGEGSSNITRRIVADVGEFIPEYDASRIVRTETMRAYRGAYRDQVETLPAGMVAGWRWISALDTRTCAICLGLHNHIFVEYPDYMHIQCRCTTAPVFSPRYAPPQDFQTGDEWLRTQPEDVQLQVLGPSRYELWRNEGIPMRDMVQFEIDPVWGGSTRLIPVRELQP